MIQSRNVSVTTLVFLLTSWLPLNAQRRSIQTAAIDSQRLVRISERLQTFVNQGTIPGAVTLVARGGKVVNLSAVGYQELESKKTMRADTIFDIRSVTKPITAIGIMILMEEGKLTLNDPIDQYLPEFKAASRKFGQTPITIHHLLTHTAGMPLNRPPEIEDITVKRDKTLSEVVTVLAKQEPEYEPGTQFRYYSGGFAILGRIIEVVSGQRFEEFIRNRIFVPLGMRDSFFFIPPAKRSRVASVYRLQDSKLSKWEELETFTRNAKYPGPEFGMYSTAPDLFALCQMMLDGGTYKGSRILSKLSVELMTQNHTLNIKDAVTQKPAYQGLGWGLSGDPMTDFPLTSRGSFGHNGAFNSIVWIDPSEKLVRIFLVHRFGPGSEIDVFMSVAGSAVKN